MVPNRPEILSNHGNFFPALSPSSRNYDGCPRAKKEKGREGKRKLGDCPPKSSFLFLGRGKGKRLLRLRRRRRIRGGGGGVRRQRPRELLSNKGRNGKECSNGNRPNSAFSCGMNLLQVGGTIGAKFVETFLCYTICVSLINTPPLLCNSR